MTKTIPFLSTLHARENFLIFTAASEKVISRVRMDLCGLLDGRYPCKPGTGIPDYAQCVDSLCFYNDWGWESVNIPSDFTMPRLPEPIKETQAWELREAHSSDPAVIVTLVTVSTDKKNFHYLIK